MLRTPVLRRQSIYRIIGEAKNEAKAEAMAEAKAEVKAEATRAKADAKWSSTREPPWVLQVGAVGGQVRPSGAAAAPLRPRFLVQRHWARPGAAFLALFRAR